MNTELWIDVDSVYFNYSLNRGDTGFLALGVIRFVFIDSPGCHYLERNERVLSTAPICTPAWAARVVWVQGDAPTCFIPPAAGSSIQGLTGTPGVPHTHTLFLPLTSSH